ncbi:hypothetical protein BJV82DRAFT_672116 [Fennellomyces sp. T-0311]|nr:hypothetical protein BJV82DRAFT_672116 [Fennellomyces sp. T-0311]
MQYRRYIRFITISQGNIKVSALIASRCPSLKTLHIRKSFGCRGGTVSSDWQVQKTPGLVELYQNYYHGSRLADIDILRQIDLEDINSPQLWNWHITVYLKERLSNYYQNSRAVGFLSRSVPNLFSIKLDFQSYDPEVIYIMQAINSNTQLLKRVELHDGYGSFDSDNLGYFFDSMAGSSLRTIVFRNVPGLAALVLDIIATKYRVIDEIAIIHCNTMPVHELATAITRCWPLMFRVNMLEVVEAKERHISSVYPVQGIIKELLRP